MTNLFTCQSQLKCISFHFSCCRRPKSMWELDPRTKICCDFKAGKPTVKPTEPSHKTTKPTTPLMITTIGTGMFWS